MFKALFIATLLLANVSVYAQEVDDSQIIASVEVSRVDTVDALIDIPAVPGNPLDEIAMYLDGLIAIGKKIRPIIDAGRPVINTTGIIPSLSVIPKIEGSDAKTAFYDMANWSAPKAASYRVSYKNKFGSEVVGFTYTVYFQFNGDHNGKGKYITNLKVQASEVYAAWGFNFNATSELIGIANVGAKEAPVGSAIIQISYVAKGLINEVRNAQSFYVDGLGVMKLLQN